MRNILLVLKDYNSACSVLKKADHNIYLYKCQTTKFDVIEYLDDDMFDRIDTIILNEKSHQSRVEYLVNSFTGDKTIHLFSNLNCTITNAKCVFYNYIKLNKIMTRLDAIEHEYTIECDDIVCKTPKQLLKRSSTYVNPIHSNHKRRNIENADKKEFRQLCCSHLDQIRCLELPTIQQNGRYEAVLIECRRLPHLEFLIRNCIHKLGANWSHTIICGNLNVGDMKNIVKRIDRDIRIVKLDVDNLTQLEYSDMLMTRNFWNLLVGEKILIYQEDTCIFKSNIDEFLQWDYIGAPFDKQNNHQNGGLSLRTRKVMLDIIEANYPLDCINCDHGKMWMTLNKHDKLPEDIYFTQHMKVNTSNKWKLAPVDCAAQFSCERIFHNDSFGMHCYWLGEGKHKWKAHFEGFIEPFADNNSIRSMSRNLLTEKSNSLHNGSRKKILMLFNTIINENCGGTKTAFKLLDVFYKMNYECIIYAENVDNCVVNAFTKSSKTKLSIYTDFNNLIDTYYDFIISTYNITFYFMKCLNCKNYIYFVQDYECSFYKNKIDTMLAYYTYTNYNTYYILLGYQYIKNKLIQIPECNIYPVNIGFSTNYCIENINFLKRKQNILFVYYKNKPRRNPELIHKISEWLTKKYVNYTFFCFPDPMPNNNIKCLGFMNESELNKTYNNCGQAFCFSTTNISRLSYEISATGCLTYELQNSNNLSNNIFALIRESCDINEFYNIFETNQNDNIYLNKISSVKKNIINHSLSNELLNYKNIINDIVLKKTNNKTKVFILCSNGDLGCDYLKGQLLSQNIYEYDVVCIPVDNNFGFYEPISGLILNKIYNSIIFMVRVRLNYNVFKMLKHNNNRIIYDPVDLFEEDVNLNYIQNIYKHSFIDIIICNNNLCKTYLSDFFNNKDLIVIYHMWDPRYNNIKKFTKQSIALGFIGCVKNIDQMICNHKNIINKYNVKLLDCECWNYVNEEYNKYINNNSRFNWNHSQLNTDNISINFNVQISIRDPLNYKNNCFKTNLKISTAACLDQLIITTKEHSNIEILPNDYPFYLNDVSCEEFDRVYKLLLNDYNGDRLLYTKAKHMLNNIKHLTNIDNIKKEYIKIINQYNII